MSALKPQFSQKELKDIRKSFFHLLMHFLKDHPEEMPYQERFEDWARQLDISAEELEEYKNVPEQLKVKLDTTEIHKAEHLFNLIYLIYLDAIIEDSELEVVGEYAQMLGFKVEIVDALLKAIVTAPYDGLTSSEVKKELEEIVEYNR